MRRYLDIDFDEIVTEYDLIDEFYRLKENENTEAETPEEYIQNCLDSSLIYIDQTKVDRLLWTPADLLPYEIRSVVREDLIEYYYSANLDETDCESYVEDCMHEKLIIMLNTSDLAEDCGFTLERYTKLCAAFADQH